MNSCLVRCVTRCSPATRTSEFTMGVVIRSPTFLHALRVNARLQQRELLKSIIAMCAKSRSHNFTLRRHAATLHPGVDPPPPLNSGRKAKESSILAPVKCQCCDKTFASRRSALYHRRAAHHEIPKPLKGERRPEEKETLSFLSFTGK